MSKIGNSPRQKLKLTLERSKSYSFALAVLHDDGVPVNITDYSFRFVLKDEEYSPSDTNALIDVDGLITSPTEGVVQFDLQADDVALEPDTYWYTIVAVDDGGYSSSLLKGEAIISANTDSESSGISHSITTPETGIEVHLRPGDIVKVFTGASSRLVAEAYIIGAGNPTQPGLLAPDIAAEVAAARVGQLFISTNLGKAWRKRLDGSWLLVEGVEAAVLEGMARDAFRAMTTIATDGEGLWWFTLPIAHTGDGVHIIQTGAF